MSTPASVAKALSPTGQVWWREPYVWLVAGGPLIVVVAALATAAIAVKNPDPVLDVNNLRQAEFMANSKQAQQAKDHLANLQPAMLGRNHAASPLPLQSSNSR